MSRMIKAIRGVGFAGLAALAFTAVAVPAPGAMAQEKEEDRRAWSFRVGVNNERPMLGVMLASDGSGEDGVLVMDVLEDSPAEKAGIIDGDVILSVDGHNLSEPLEGEDEEHPETPVQRVWALLSEVPEGESVTLVVERDDERLTFSVVPERLPYYTAWWPGSGRGAESLRGLSEWWSDESSRQEALERIRELAQGFRNPPLSFEWDSAGWTPPRALRFFADTLPTGEWSFRWDGGRVGSRGTHGLDLVELNPGLGAYFGTSEGVLVADALDDTSLGLQPGDVVVAVDGRAVDDIDELRRILRSYRNDEEITFRIFRDGARTTVTGTIN
ncbi:MAG: PDZ domain-containing protein [Gemmatimonadota bacterium]|nr:PDZ domain-containing protein [Gemmatimonadota bacterium]